MSLNKVMLIGRLGRDPEMRQTKAGKPIANLNLATTEAWKDKHSGERKEKTEWHSVVVFNEGLCRVVEAYLRKGSQVYVEGQLQTRKWLDNAGNQRYTTEVVLQNFNSTLVMLDSKQDRPDTNWGEESEKKPSGGASDLDAEPDIPF